MSYQKIDSLVDFLQNTVDKAENDLLKSPPDYISGLFEGSWDYHNTSKNLESYCLGQGINLSESDIDENFEIVKGILFLDSFLNEYSDESNDSLFMADKRGFEPFSVSIPFSAIKESTGYNVTEGRLRAIADSGELGRFCSSYSFSEGMIHIKSTASFCFGVCILAEDLQELAAELGKGE